MVDQFLNLNSTIPSESLLLPGELEAAFLENPSRRHVVLRDSRIHGPHGALRQEREQSSSGNPPAPELAVDPIRHRRLLEEFELTDPADNLAVPQHGPDPDRSVADHALPARLKRIQRVRILPSEGSHAAAPRVRLDSEHHRGIGRRRGPKRYDPSPGLRGHRRGRARIGQGPARGVPVLPRSGARNRTVSVDRRATFRAPGDRSSAACDDDCRSPSRDPTGPGSSGPGGGTRHGGRDPMTQEPGTGPAIAALRRRTPAPISVLPPRY